MKLVLFYLKGKSEPWVEEASAGLTKRISQIFAIELTPLKSKSLERGRQEEKISAETDVIKKNIKTGDTVILFDPSGKSFRSSEEFSHELIRQAERKNSRVVFIIGGPYGFGAEIRARADAVWSLSPLTFNHHVAQIVALEQIYRGLSIWRGLPYHNA